MLTHVGYVYECPMSSIRKSLYCMNDDYSRAHYRLTVKQKRYSEISLPKIIQDKLRNSDKKLHITLSQQTPAEISTLGMKYDPTYELR